jgi:hypothetical protein
LVVKTLATSYEYGDDIAAYDDPPLSEQCFYRPRIKIMTDLNNLVTVMAKHGGFDILVSPEDVPGFVAAVWEVAAEVECKY